MWYRLYELDKDDHILKAESLEFASDADAIAAVEARAGRHGLELWQAQRRIGQFRRRPQVSAA